MRVQPPQQMQLNCWSIWIIHGILRIKYMIEWMRAGSKNSLFAGQEDKYYNSILEPIAESSFSGWVDIINQERNLQQEINQVILWE